MSTPPSTPTRPPEPAAVPTLRHWMAHIYEIELGTRLRATAFPVAAPDRRQAARIATGEAVERGYHGFAMRLVEREAPVSPVSPVAP